MKASNSGLEQQGKLCGIDDGLIKSKNMRGSSQKAELSSSVKIHFPSPSPSILIRSTFRWG